MIGRIIFNLVETLFILLSPLRYFSPHSPLPLGRNRPGNEIIINNIISSTLYTVFCILLYYYYQVCSGVNLLYTPAVFRLVIYSSSLSHYGCQGEDNMSTSFDLYPFH